MLLCALPGLASGLHAQLRVDAPVSLSNVRGAVAGATEVVKSGERLPFSALIFGTTAETTVTTQQRHAADYFPAGSLLNAAGSRTRAQPTTFDFSRSAPHLAFFCRLEINEAAGNIIPVKFRLGGHRHWQDDLRRR